MHFHPYTYFANQTQAVAFWSLNYNPLCKGAIVLLGEKVWSLLEHPINNYDPSDRTTNLLCTLVPAVRERALGPSPQKGAFDAYIFLHAHVISDWSHAGRIFI